MRRLITTVRLTVMVLGLVAMLAGCGCDRSAWDSLDPRLQATLEQILQSGPLLVHPELAAPAQERSSQARAFPLFSAPGAGLDAPILEYDFIVLRPGVETEALLGCPAGMWTGQDAGGGYLLLTNHYKEDPYRWLAAEGKAETPEQDRLAVPAGTFTAGGSKNLEDLGGLTTYAAVPAKIEPFRIGRIETTNGQFAAFLAGLPDRSGIDRLYNFNHPAAKIVRLGSQVRALTGCESMPVTCVTWHGADAFCRGQGGRLPDDVRWELAARGYERRLYPWGDEFDAQRANLFGDDDGHAWLAPADSMPQGAGPFGTLHQAGNAYEWVDNPDRPAADGPVIGCDLRGGAWDTLPFTARSDAVDNNNFDAANQHNGFRCAW